VTAPLSFAEFLTHFSGVKKDGADWVATCPVHKGGQEAHPSLGLAEKASGPVLFCRSHHCDPNEILAAVELTWRDILPPKPGTNGANGKAWLPADVIYDYTSREGVLLYRVHRWHAVGSTPKKILQQAADGSWGLKGKGIPLVPYRLHALTGPTVLVAEGEKAVNALVQADFNATTNTGGTGMGWRDHDTLALKAVGITTLLILPDHDAAGYLHAGKIEASAAKHGLTTRRILLPGLGEGEDAYDWLLTHTAAELEALLDAPEAAPGPPEGWADVEDAVDVAAEGRKIHEEGVPWVVEGLIPAYGMFGFMVAQAKVGKTTFGQALAAAVATGTPFLGFPVTQGRVLIVAAEDPKEYTAYLARHLTVPRGVFSFWRKPIQLDAAGLARLTAFVTYGGFKLVLIASWQSVVSTLVKDENDNASAVRVVNLAQDATRGCGVPWVVDAHAGKGEDQSDEADPTLALRGASSAAGAADFLISLRYEGDPSSVRRRLSAKGRFLTMPLTRLLFDRDTGRYTAPTPTSPSALRDTDYQLLLTVLSPEPASPHVLARESGIAPEGKPVQANHRDRVHAALRERPGVEKLSTPKGDRNWVRYRLIGPEGA